MRGVPISWITIGQGGGGVLTRTLALQHTLALHHSLGVAPRPLCRMHRPTHAQANACTGQRSEHAGLS